MSTKTRQYIKDRFRTGMYPTENDFGDVFDSYVHKSDNIDIAQVRQENADGTSVPLSAALNSKAEQAQVDGIDGRVTNLEQRSGEPQDITALQESMNSLNSRMDTLETSATRTFTFKGSVTCATVSSIDTTTLSVGDVFNITDSGTVGDLEVSTGDCLCWNGTAWDTLSYTDYTDIYARIAQKVDLQQLGYPTFSAIESYSAGQIVVNNGYMVRFLTDHTPGAWNPEETEDITLAELLAELSPAALFTKVAELERNSVTQNSTIATMQGNVSSLSAKQTEQEQRLDNLEEQQGDIDLTEVYTRIGQVDDKADAAVSDAAEAKTIAQQASTTASGVAQTAINAAAAASTAETNAAAASALVNSLSSTVSTLTSTVSSLQQDVDNKVTNVAGVDSIRAMSMSAYDELASRPATTFYILTAN